MHVKNKKKLGIALVLFTLLLLIAGTFAFTAFNQRAINDRLRDNLGEVGGRVHDYYNRDTENKDVFVENYGEEPIMARIRLSEFMAIRARGEESFNSIVPTAVRESVETWTTYIPSTESLSIRTGDSAVFNQYANLTFGWAREGEYAPWYLPTFNHVENDLMTAAAGHARDYIAGSGATDGSTDGATHPGTGEDAYWQEGESYTNGQGPTSTVWPGALDGVERTTAQNLPQDRAPLTLQQWAALPNEHKIGDFWVIDHETGWAYWASQLQEGETSSYLLDAAVMTEAAHDIRGSYYYAIHVDSQLITPEQEFYDEPESGDVERLLRGIRNNAVDDDNDGVSNGDGNPEADVPSPVSNFDFEIMNLGRRFTTLDGQQFRYLEDIGNGNHLIIREQVIQNVPRWNWTTRLNEYYDIGISQDLKNLVQPVANTFRMGMIPEHLVIFENVGMHSFPTHLWGDAASDETRVVQGASGRPRAFMLSLADMTRLSHNGSISQNSQRVSSDNPGRAWWWLRTPGYTAENAFTWYVSELGALRADTYTPFGLRGGIRPALIIHQ
ncbi:DUF6273 domain-containing protein [Lactococcus ileimucosae]|uniref:DUF6273 domain-containing protein n=1 Tax=Lactococcus ileimucosae TaxID=2941329 RepID=A0ABV4D5Q2_9LACT